MRLQMTFVSEASWHKGLAVECVVYPQTMTVRLVGFARKTKERDRTEKRILKRGHSLDF